MTDDSDRLIKRFVSTASEFSLSIMLVGSQAMGLAHDDSDIDLIVITKGHEEVAQVLQIAENLESESERPLLDCKVYTEEVFNKAKSSIENRFIWTCIYTGKMLYGRDITKIIQIKPQYVIEEYWVHVQSTEQAVSNLESNLQFTGSCYHLYAVLGTTYFIHSLILSSIDRTYKKENFIASVLGDEFSRVRERYYWVVNHLDEKVIQTTVRIPSNIDNHYKKRDYVSILEKSDEVLRIARETYRQVAQWAEDQT